MINNTRPRLYKAIVTENEKINPKVNRVVLSLIEPTEIHFESGQFISLEVASETYRAYSISSDPSENHSVEIIVATSHNGLGSNYVRDLKPNDIVSFMGPSGNFCIRNEGIDKVFIATGTGIAPFLSFIKQTTGYENTTLLHGIRDDTELIYSEFFKEYEEKMKNMRLEICFSKQEQSKYQGVWSFGRVTERIEKYYSANAIYYLCGNPNMIEESIKILHALGVEDSKIKTEKF